MVILQKEESKIMVMCFVLSVIVFLLNFLWFNCLPIRIVQCMREQDVEMIKLNMRQVNSKIMLNH